MDDKIRQATCRMVKGQADMWIVQAAENADASVTWLTPVFDRLHDVIENYYAGDIDTGDVAAYFDGLCAGFIDSDEQALAGQFRIMKDKMVCLLKTAYFNE